MPHHYSQAAQLLKEALRDFAPFEITLSEYGPFFCLDVGWHIVTALSSFSLKKVPIFCPKGGGAAA